MATPPAPPGPAGVRTHDDLAARLRSLRSWAGVPYREVHRRIVRRRRDRGIAELPGFATVHRCFQPGRSRLDAELVVDVVQALLGDQAAVAEWRQACQVVDGRAGEASVVEVSTELPPDLPRFTGRRQALRQVFTAVTADQPAELVMIHGMAGAGKTAMATHVGRRLAESWPGGQLMVDLRGWDPARPPADPPPCWPRSCAGSASAAARSNCSVLLTVRRRSAS